MVMRLCVLRFFINYFFCCHPTVDLLVISNNGASGVYPGCTDMAYTKAIQDGVDVLDCPVQMTKDGIPICLGSINLIDITNIVQTGFSSLSTTVPEIMLSSGIFTFNLAWSDIKSLKGKLNLVLVCLFFIVLNCFLFDLFFLFFSFFWVGLDSRVFNPFTK